MDSNELEILISPSSSKPLYLKKDSHTEWLVSESGERFPIIQDIPQLFNPQELNGINALNLKYYDKVSHFSRLLDIICARFIDYNKILQERIQDIEVKSNDKVLEVAIGTGWNIKLLTPTAKYYGLDISLGTLKQCKKNCKRWNRDINLVHGVAEQLPFRDNSFDVVFHISGISFFGDRKQAMLEMIRVAIKLFISMNS